MTSNIDEQVVLPLSAVVGCDSARRALLLLAINPRLGGLLIRGERGTAKSTLARGLARLLPDNDAGPAPFETLPLGITEDQLLGTIDLEQALREGRRRFEPGLLARVHQGVLYVDEVNLLDDHIVDLLLDVAASGVNVVAREGVRSSHPASFLLIGTMNPDEGELRPQLTDRFGLCVDLVGLTVASERTLVVERCLAFEADPAGFVEEWRQAEGELARSIATGRELLAEAMTATTPTLLRQASGLALAMGAEGHRADILLVKTAATLAASEGRTVSERGDLERAALLVFPHRLKRNPFEEEQLSADELSARISEALEQDADGAGERSEEGKPAGSSR